MFCQHIFSGFQVALGHWLQQWFWDYYEVPIHYTRWPRYLNELKPATDAVYWLYLSHETYFPNGTGQVTPRCVIDVDHHWVRYRLAACLEPGHCLNQCCHIVNSHCSEQSREKFEWIYNTFHSRNAFVAAHDDVIKWKHFPRYWPFVRGIHRSPVNSPNKGQWRGALVGFFICTWMNC